LKSYPNQIPLSAAEVKKVCQPLEKVHFDKAFGAFEGFDVWGGKAEISLLADLNFLEIIAKAGNRKERSAHLIYASICSQRHWVKRK
jgi:hypothetical protein